MIALCELDWEDDIKPKLKYAPLALAPIAMGLGYHGEKKAQNAEADLLKKLKLKASTPISVKKQIIAGLLAPIPVVGMISGAKRAERMAKLQKAQEFLSKYQKV